MTRRIPKWLAWLIPALLLLTLLAGREAANFVIWRLDCIRNWEVRLPARTAHYTAVFVHRPGFDFYDTLMEVSRSDGKKATIIIDGDDHKWWFPRIITNDNTISFIALNEDRSQAPRILCKDEAVQFFEGWRKNEIVRFTDLEFQ